jgi:hypothetical protein
MAHTAQHQMNETSRKSRFTNGAKKGIIELVVGIYKELPPTITSADMHEKRKMTEND